MRHLVRILPGRRNGSPGKTHCGDDIPASAAIDRNCPMERADLTCEACRAEGTHMVFHHPEGAKQLVAAVELR